MQRDYTHEILMPAKNMASTVMVDSFTAKQE